MTDEPWCDPTSRYVTGIEVGTTFKNRQELKREAGTFAGEPEPNQTNPTYRPTYSPSSLTMPEDCRYLNRSESLSKTISDWPSMMRS